MSGSQLKHHCCGSLRFVKTLCECKCDLAENTHVKFTILAKALDEVKEKVRENLERERERERERLRGGGE
jgi:hypothetical protein